MNNRKTVLAVILTAVFALCPLWGQETAGVFGDSFIRGIAWGNGKFVAVGGDGKIACSSDGVKWTLAAKNVFDSSDIIGIAFGNGRFVAVGGDRKIAYSTDGDVWNLAANSSYGNFQFFEIAFGNEIFVAVGDENKIAVSKDGKNWKKTNFDGRFAYIYDISFGNGKFIAVGNTGNDSGFLYTSDDGLTWTQRDSSFHPQAGDITTAAGGNGRFIAVGDNGALAVSDGKAEEWELLVSNSSSASNVKRNSIYSIIYADGKFVGVGEKGYIATSTDGINWTDIKTGISDIHYGDFHFTERGGKLTVINYYGKEKNVVIPAAVNGKPVTGIGEKAFYWKGLTGVTIPNGVITIGKGTFQSNEFSSINIPNSVTNIGDSAFSDNQLTSITIPNSVITIGESAFYDNQLTDVTIGSGVTSIGDGAFRGFFGNKNLITINVAAGNTAYSSQDGVLYDKSKKLLIQCPAGKSSVSIPSTVTSIGEYAFDNSKMDRIVFPDSVTSIGRYAFYGTRLISVTIGAGVTVGRGNQFEDAYNSNGKQAGTYTRTDTDTTTWTRKEK